MERYRKESRCSLIMQEKRNEDWRKQWNKKKKKFFEERSKKRRRNRHGWRSKMNAISKTEITEKNTMIKNKQKNDNG